METRTQCLLPVFPLYCLCTNNMWIYSCKILKFYRIIKLKSNYFLSSLSSYTLRVNSYCYIVAYIFCCRKKNHKCFFFFQTLKFLAKCRMKKKLFAPWQGLRELTDAQRVELKQHVDDYIRRHPVCSLLCYISVSLF